MVTNTTHFLTALHQHHHRDWAKGISTEKIVKWLEDLLNILFPQKTFITNELNLQWETSKEHFSELLQASPQCGVTDLSGAANLLYDALPGIYEKLQSDAMALLNNDPAATNIPEIINAYPGFFAVAVYRIAHAIANISIPFIPRVLTEYAHSKTGIDIHPAAKIDVPFVIDHGTGVVIGATTVIGKNVQIYQGVTLGALWVEKNLELTKRHPTVEHNVIIYANATILGGSTVIGNNSIIGGNTFITKSVNPFSLVQQSGKNSIVNRQDIQDNNSFTI